jgi:hypothetical protein
MSIFIYNLLSPSWTADILWNFIFSGVVLEYADCLFIVSLLCVRGLRRTVVRHSTASSSGYSLSRAFLQDVKVTQAS